MPKKKFFYLSNLIYAVIPLNIRGLIDNNIKLKPLDVQNYINDNNRIYSSILIIIHFHHDVPFILLTKRSKFLKRHAGEISFPGGKYSQSQDKTFLDTAIRETFEEIGIWINKEQVIGCLDPVFTYTSKILIYPYVVIKDKIPDKLEPNFEVEEIINLPIERLIECVSMDEHHSTKNYAMYKFIVDEYVIWGATARIIKNLLDLIKK